MTRDLRVIRTKHAAAAILSSSTSNTIQSENAWYNPKPPQLAQTAPTKFVSVNGSKLAYRRFGKPTNVPLLFLTHFRGSMDVLDPLLVNTIARNREVILVDNSGIGHSQGTVPDSIQAMAATAVNFLAAIKISKADILGFSMGGMVAQYIAMEYPQVVNKLVLAGVRPGYGPGVVQTPPDAASGPGGEPDSQPTEDYMLGIFFYPSDTSRASGNLWWDRISERHVRGEKREAFVVGAGVGAQLTAITNFASNPKLYNRLDNITGPVLVTNGKDDILMGTANSFVLQQQLVDAQLHLYPDSGHGHLFQFPLAYAMQLELFLKG
ncbi:Alpha/Beta hydrolase protein [Dactylonectria estremocensis]|uniref:Alpha/Beta hydrolase protein n=1 Tax=Dactylonectria estremocensis TaxID=1079267 RepID=A0A9P9JKB4_9HYPO|nr:Alpha/Beta hydrolase protein [Dactylonectria estremocensis]